MRSTTRNLRKCSNFPVPLFIPIEFHLTGGEVHDCKAAPALIAKLPASEHTIADKGYDSEDVREQIRNKSSNPVIPRKKNSKACHQKRTVLNAFILFFMSIIDATWCCEV